MPNPADNQLFVNLIGEESGQISYSIINPQPDVALLWHEAKRIRSPLCPAFLEYVIKHFLVSLT